VPKVRQIGGLLATTLVLVGVTAVVTPSAFAAPANDHFANATTISDGYVYGSNVGATRETGEPNHAGTTGEVYLVYLDRAD
jgi:hypothetical protein